MNLSNNELDQLFENVRKEKPVASFEETQRAFVAASIATVGGVLATKALLKLFTFKQWIIMISVLSTATVGTLLVTMSSAPVEESGKKTESYLHVPAKEINVEETPEEVVEETVEKEVVSTEMPEVLQKLEKIKALTSKLKETRVKSIVETRTTATTYHKNSGILKAYDKGDGTYAFEYIITSETTEQELRELKENAKKAGFELTYEPSFSDSKLIRLSLHIVQNKGNGQRHNVHISDIDLGEDAGYKIAWNVDEEGEATNISCGEDFRSTELEEFMGGWNMHGFSDEDDSLAILFRNSPDFSAWNEELKALREELILLKDDLDSDLAILGDGSMFDISDLEGAIVITDELLANPELIESVISAQSVLDEDIMEEVRQELEDARELLKDEQERMKRECAKMQEECNIFAKKCAEGHEKLLAELKKDGLIEDEEDSVRIKATKKKIKVNGKDLTKEQQKKYEGLIKEYFDVNLNQSGDVTWRFSHNED